MVADPLRADDIEELMRWMTPEELVAFYDAVASVGDQWLPNPGAQTRAFDCTADITGYGGAAGGGKTDLACGLATTKHWRSIIYRREAGQLQAVIDRLEEMVGGRDGFNSTNGVWRLPGGRQVELGGFPNLGNERRYQGRPHDLKVFDEVTEMMEAQVRFLMGWLRSSKGVRQRVLMTMNPPTTSEGRWVIPFFGPWLDKKHPRPAKDGEIRWFTTIAGVDQEVPDGRHFVLVDGERVYDFNPTEYSGPRATLVIRPMSRTFIFAKVTDNPRLKGDYIAKLQAMPEPLRSQMLNGDFTAGIEDDANQLIPTAHVEAAMARWKPRDAKGPMDSIGVDVSRGNMGGAAGGGAGKDRTVIARRHGTWFDDLVSLKGLKVEDGPAVASAVIQRRRDGAVVHIDIVGVGTSPYDFLNTNNVQVVGVNGAAKSEAHDKSGQLRFTNLRSELWWRMREALDPSNPDPIALPDDAELLSDLTAPRWWLTPAGIQVEPKRGKPGADGKPTGLVARLGRSPDRGDAAVYALLSTPKRNVVFSGYAGVPRPSVDRYAELNGGR